MTRERPQDKGRRYRTDQCAHLVALRLVTIINPEEVL